jgi:hypothetical protein
MPVVLLIVGAVLIVAAFNNAQGNLATALETDVPGFAHWFLAIAVVGGLGYVPGMRSPSRWLLGLVMLVLVLRNYTNIFAGFKNAAAGSSAVTQSQTTPAAAYVANPSAPVITTAQISGTTTGNVNAATAPVAQTAFNPLSPASYLAPFTTDLSSMGFGGVA